MKYQDKRHLKVRLNKHIIFIYNYNNFKSHTIYHFDTTATTSSEQNINDTIETIEDYFRKNAFFFVFDAIMINLEKRFSTESL
jgi:hypothetical protein